MKIISKNKKAFFEYFIEEEIEAGMVLQGSEVKSIRAGRVSISEGYVVIIKSEAFIINMNIAEFENSYKSVAKKYDPTRNRKLLLHKKQINKLIGRLHKTGLTMVPTVLYWSEKNKIKIKIAIAKGKKTFDKRNSIKEKDQKRNARKEEAQ
jgi:SsrA-binding protein